MTVRQAALIDLPALVAALDQREYFTHQLARQARGLGALLVAWCDGQPVGDVYVRWEPAEEPEIRRHLAGVPLIMHLEVLEQYRNQGLGTDLLRAAERLLWDRGHRRAALGVSTENDGAKRLYERLGYVAWTQPDVVTKGDVFQVFVKSLL